MPSPKLMTMEEVMAELQISRSSVDRLRRAGRLPFVRLTAGGPLRIKASELEAFIDSLEVAA